jgi:cytochrome c
MDSFELNKIIGAVLGTLLFVMGVGFLAEAIYHPIEDRGPGYALPEPAATTADAGNAAPAAPEVPLGTLLASADPEQGAAAAKKCHACHDFTEGGPNKTGPNLYDVVDRPIGSHPGFNYSDGMKEHNANGDIWSYENLSAFITSPKTFTPGTKMSFSGIKDDKERADVLAYLQTLSHDPKPFPQPEAAPADDSAQPAAEGEQPAANDNATPAAEDAPAATETPATMQDETDVEGTPTNSEAAPANDNAAPAADAPATEQAPAASGQ